MDNPPSLKKQWQLTSEAFERFLANLDADRDRAGEAYERLRVKLVKLFEWERCTFPEERVDNVINRVCRKLDEGEVIESLERYCSGVARNVVREIRKGPDSKRVDIEEFDQIQDRPNESEGENEEELYEHYQKCLRELSEEKRTLILEYYEGVKQKKIEGRERIADRLGINLDALRTRARRIRNEIRDCVRRRLGVKK